MNNQLAQSEPIEPLLPTAPFLTVLSSGQTIGLAFSGQPQDAEVQWRVAIPCPAELMYRADEPCIRKSSLSKTQIQLNSPGTYLAELVVNGKKDHHIIRGKPTTSDYQVLTYN